MIGDIVQPCDLTILAVVDNVLLVGASCRRLYFRNMITQNALFPFVI